MHVSSMTKYGLAIVAASLGLGAAASAQPYSNGPTESVIVAAPRLRVDTAPLNAPMGKASMSVDVRYDDLNLNTRSGSDTLRWRLWRTAHEVCDRLADAYPVYQLSTAPSCVKTAYEDAMVRAYGVVGNARVDYWLSHNAYRVGYHAYPGNYAYPPASYSPPPAGYGYSP